MNDYTLDAMQRELARPRVPRIIKGPEDLARLYELVQQGKSRVVRKDLKQRANRVIAFYMRHLGSKRGAPRTQKALVYTLAARLRKEDPKRYSWDKLAKKLDSRGYKVNPKLSIDRIRMGVREANKRMNTSREVERPPEKTPIPIPS